ncbi:MAG: hypothetical protein QM500_15975, partial [Methylococcales bacterium]
LFVVVVGYFLVSIGLIWSQQTLDSVQHSFSAYQDLLSNPQAIFLILVSLCMSVIAYHKGLSSFDDRYPHYGALKRAVIKTQNELIDLFEGAFASIHEHFDDVLGDVNKRLNEQQKSVREHSAAMSILNGKHSELKQSAQQEQTELQNQITSLHNHYQAT